MITEKKCTGCQEIKPSSDFSKWKRGKDGLQNYCKVCNRKYLKKFNVEYLPQRREGDQTKTGSYLNHIWLKMIKRCNDPADRGYPMYGGRGISVCERWLQWELFLEDMLEDYEQGLSLERIDVNGDYCPENCKWITRREQAFNKQDTIYISTPSGEKVSLTKHAYEIGFNRGTAYTRFMKYGDDYEKVFCPYELRDRSYDYEVKEYIAKNVHLSASEIINYVQENFNETLTRQYVRQVKSDWKRGITKSVLLKLFGPYEDFNKTLDTQQ